MKLIKKLIITLIVCAIGFGLCWIINENSFTINLWFGLG
jgi:hypothetical protein